MFVLIQIEMLEGRISIWIRTKQPFAPQHSKRQGACFPPCPSSPHLAPSLRLLRWRKCGGRWQAAGCQGAGAGLDVESCERWWIRTRTQGSFGALSPSHLLLCPCVAFHSGLTPVRNPSQVREMQRLSLVVALLILGCAHGWEGNVDMMAYFEVDCDGVGAIADGRLTFVKSVSESAPSPPPLALQAASLRHAGSPRPRLMQCSQDSWRPLSAHPHSPGAL